MNATRLAPTLFALALVPVLACGGGQKAARKDAAPASQPATTAVAPIPEGYHSLTPGLVVSDVAAASAWYVRALGAVATELVSADDGTVIHAEVRIGDSTIMLSPEDEAHGAKGPLTLGGTNGGLLIYVPDVDATFAGAVEAGATAVMPVGDMFWGDRYGQLTDPWGHRWSVATHKFDLSSEVVAERARAWGAIRGSSAAFVFRWLRGGPEVRLEPGVRAVLRLSHDDRSGAFGTSITPPPQGEPRCARL